MLSDAPYAPGSDALLIAENAAQDVREALAAARLRLRAHGDFASAEALIGEPGLDLILVDLRGAPEAAADKLPAMVAAREAEPATPLAVLIAADQLELAGPLLGARGVHLLCDPRAAELLATLMLARAGRPQPALLSVHDITRDSEAARLRRLNEEVARIAEALTRLTRGALAEEAEVERRGGVRESELPYRGPEGPPPGPEIEAAEIRAAIRARRLRGQFFAAELFADPAWDMLLDLFAASLERRRVSVSSLCIAAAVPPTTALRWIGTMHDAGLFGREADPGDRRRAYIVLSEKAVQGMRAYFGALRRAGLALA